MMNKEILIEKINNLDELKHILLNFDNCFEPSISSLVGDLKIYAEKLYKNAYTFKALYNNEVIGFTSFYCNDHQNYEGYLTQIVVLKQYRKNGVGQLLLNKVVEVCCDKKMKSLKLEVFNDNNFAINFYKKNGFEISKEASTKSKYMKKNL